MQLCKYLLLCVIFFVTFFLKHLLLSVIFCNFAAEFKNPQNFSIMVADFIQKACEFIVGEEQHITDYFFYTQKIVETGKTAHYCGFNLVDERTGETKPCAILLAIL